MTATTVTQDLTPHTLDDTAPSVATRERPFRSARPALAGKLYRFHGLRVLDTDDRPVGIVDWIWSDQAGDQGTFIGVELRWLRGTARAIPVHDLHIDRQSGTIQVAYSKEQIKRAPRFAIDRVLTAKQKRSIRSHYTPSRTVVSPATMAEGRAA